jgi:hypothetical protein
MAGRISMGARREVVSAVAERYRPAKRAEKGRILDELCATTGWHRKHAVRALRQRETVMPGEVEASRERRRRYGATIKDALTALWEASDRVCGERLKVMIPTLLPALERNGRLTLDVGSRSCSHHQRCNHRPPARRCKGRGERRQAATCGLLLGNPARGPDPHVQRLEKSAAGLLRGRHGSTWRLARRRGDETRTGPVPLAFARRGLRQR